MGHTKRRASKDGSMRYTAVYIDIQGSERSAGTFSTEKAANKAWQRAEAKVDEGRVTSTQHGRQKFSDFVLETWLPDHVMEESTRQNATYMIRRRLVPEFGGMRMNEVLPQHVQSWVRNCQKEGLAASTIHRMTTILSAIFASAVVNQVIFTNPCKGVVLPTVGRKNFEIITPEQFASLHSSIEEERFQLMADVAIESGLRWGELSELRVKDLDRETGILAVCRAVVELTAKNHPTGGRFLVKDYPKGRRFRRFKIDRSLVHKITAFTLAHGIRGDDLIFQLPLLPTDAPFPGVPDGVDLGFTAPNDKGRRYRHGTTTAYTTGKCRCDYCRAAFAHYRAVRRAEGKDSPRRRRTVTTDNDRHIPADWFRSNVWRPAIAKSGLPAGVTIQQLRHAHASWLLAGGADLGVVRDRLGHASITTTELYLHTLPEADDSALHALSKIRYRSASPATER